VVDEDQAGKNDRDQDHDAEPQKTPEKELRSLDAQKQPPEIITDALNEIHNYHRNKLKRKALGERRKVNNPLKLIIYY